ncbi:VanZ family protein [Brotaphodocola sp.]|uniref:VanZ family protein n=1 Tax=Brotaphodocola sp. TaxID=3073577 RepID=UPI003D7DC55E
MWKYVWKDILEQACFLPVTAVLALIYYSLRRAIVKRRGMLNREMKHQLFWKACMAMYLMMLVQITLLEREAGSRTKVSLELFETFGGPMANAFVMENVLLFMPYGLILPMIWKSLRKMKILPQMLICTMIGFFSSLMIECTQLVTQRGFFQVDDIMTNTVGMVCGWLIYRIISMLVS